MAKRPIFFPASVGSQQIPPHYIADLDVIPTAAFIRDCHGVYRNCNRAFALFLNLPREKILGRSIGDLYPPALAQQCRDQDREVMKAPGLCRFTTSFRVMDGPLIAADILKSPLQDDRGKVAGILGVFAGHFPDRLPAAQTAAEVVTAREDLRKQNDYLSLLNKTALALINRRNVDDVLAEIAAGAAALAGTKNALILLLNPGGEALTVRAATGAFAGYVGQAFSAAMGLNRQIVTTGQPLVVNNYQKWPLRSDDPRVAGLEAIMGVPLKAAGKVAGVIVFLSADKQATFDNHLLDLIVEFADLASLALENARLHAAAQLEISERKRAEEALEKSRAMLQSVMDGVHFGMAVISPAMRVIAVNKFIERFFSDIDFTQAPYCALAFHRIAAQACSACPVKAAFRDGAVHESIFKQAQADGEKSIRLIAAPIRDESGAVVAVVEMSEDITKRLLAEEEIRKLSQAVDQSPGIVLITDIDGRITYINAKFTQLLGFTADEVLGKSPDDILKTGVHSADFYDNVWETIKSGREWRGEFCNKKKNGDFFWALTSISPVKNAAGQISYYLAIQHDITEQKTMEEALRVSREKLSLATELAHLGPWNSDMNTRCFEFGNEFYAIYATDTTREGRFMPWETYAREFVHPDDAWQVGKEVEKALSSPGQCYTTRVVHRIIRRDGEVRTVAVMVKIVKDDDGNIIQWYGANQDITEQQETERALEEKNRELQDALEKLRHTQAQLIQQEKMAGIGQLAAGVAHEINNPLSFVLSNFDTLQKYLARLSAMMDVYRELPRLVRAGAIEAQLALADKIAALEASNKIDHIMDDLKPIFLETDEGIGRVANIVKALLLFSRVDHQESFEEYDLNAGIRTTLVVARNEIKYVASVDEQLGDIPPIEAAGGKINQVLLNILLNAAQAVKSRHAGATGQIKIRSYSDGPFVYCAIEDNGPGIPAEIRTDIFNPFFTTKPVGTGTGLGLSISYDIIVNRHHGAILVDSAVGAGATFTIKLPVKQPPRTASRPDQPPPK